MKPSPTHKILLAIFMLSIAILGCLKQKTQINPREFSIDQCACPELTLAFNEEGSSASNNTYQTTISGYDGSIEIKGRLTCDWQEEYQSEQKVGTISAYLQVIRIQEEDQAKGYYKQIKERVTSLPAYCEEDHDCLVIEYDIGPERIFYAEENTFGGQEGEVLPSYHNAYLVRNIYGSNDHYVVDLIISHPELDPGSTYVVDTAAAIEACLDPLGSQ